MKKRIAMLIVIAVLVLASIAVTVIHAYATDTVVTEDQGENEAVESISESETDFYEITEAEYEEILRKQEEERKRVYET